MYYRSGARLSYVLCINLLLLASTHCVFTLVKNINYIIPVIPIDLVTQSFDVILLYFFTNLAFK